MASSSEKRGIVVGWKKGRKERVVESKVVESLSGGRGSARGEPWSPEL